jgi:hypothetical protein
MSRKEWESIGKLASWWVRECAKCHRKMPPLMPGTLDINPNYIKDENDPHFAEVYQDDDKGDEKIPSHGVCNECGKILYPDMKELFDKPINNPIGNAP